MSRAVTEDSHPDHGGAVELKLLDSSMPVELLHAMIGTLFVVLWAIIGQFCVCNR